MAKIATRKIMKKVLISRERFGMWENIAEAAESMGVSERTISRKLKDGDMRFVERIFAVRRKEDGEWTVAVRAEGNRGFVTLGQNKIKDVDGIRELTPVWYGICRAEELKKLH